MNSLLLRKSHKLNELMVDDAINHQCSAEEKIKRIEFIALFNFKTLHTGSYVFLALENELKKIGEQITRGTQKRALNLGEGNGKYKILHIASALYDVGGHTRIFEQYVDIDRENAHYLFLTKQVENKIPKRIARLERGSIKKIFTNEAQNSIETAKHLFSIAENFDIIVLIHHPNDSIPLLALSTLDNTPIICIDHADHVSWLGATIIDFCINYRPFGLRIAGQKRGIKNSTVIPVIVEKGASGVTKADARKELGMSADQVVFITIASYWKFIPGKSHSYFSAVSEILEMDRNIHFYVIGVSDKDKLDVLDYSHNERIHLLGIIEEPKLYQIAADFYIESMPHGSLTSLLESIKLGAYPILGYSPESTNINMNSQLEFEGLVSHAKNREDYLKEIKRLLGISVSRRLEFVGELQERMNHYNSSTYWRMQLQMIYGNVFNAKRGGKNIKEYNEDEDEISANYLMMSKLKKEKISLFSIIQSQFVFYKFSNFIRAIPLLWQFSFNDKKLRTCLSFIFIQTQRRLAVSSSKNA